MAEQNSHSDPEEMEEGEVLEESPEEQLAREAAEAERLQIQIAEAEERLLAARGRLASLTPGRRTSSAPARGRATSRDERRVVASRDQDDLRSHLEQARRDKGKTSKPLNGKSSSSGSRAGDPGFEGPVSSLVQADDHRQVQSVTTFACPECGKQYRHKRSMLRHVQSHEGQFWVCMGCGRRYHERTELVRHQKHTGHRKICQIRKEASSKGCPKDRSQTSTRQSSKAETTKQAKPSKRQAEPVPTEKSPASTIGEDPQFSVSLTTPPAQEVRDKVAAASKQPKETTAPGVPATRNDEPRLASPDAQVAATLKQQQEATAPGAPAISDGEPRTTHDTPTDRPASMPRLIPQGQASGEVPRLDDLAMRARRARSQFLFRSLEAQRAAASEMGIHYRPPIEDWGQMRPGVPVPLLPDIQRLLFPLHAPRRHEVSASRGRPPTPPARLVIPPPPGQIPAAAPDAMARGPVEPRSPRVPPPVVPVGEQQRMEPQVADAEPAPVPQPLQARPAARRERPVSRVAPLIPPVEPYHPERASGWDDEVPAHYPGHRVMQEEVREASQRYRKAIQKPYKAPKEITWMRVSPWPYFERETANMRDPRQVRQLRRQEDRALRERARRMRPYSGELFQIEEIQCPGAEPEFGWNEPRSPQCIRDTPLVYGIPVPKTPEHENQQVHVEPPQSPPEPDNAPPAGNEVEEQQGEEQ